MFSDAEGEEALAFLTESTMDGQGLISPPSNVKTANWR